MLRVFYRRHSGAGLEAAQKGALFQGGYLRPFGNAYSLDTFSMQPVLNLQDRLIRVIKAWCEAAAVPLLPASRID
jgi:hypothetical protein